MEIFLVLCKGPLTFLFYSLKTVLALQVPVMLCSHQHSPAMEVTQCPRDCSLQGASPPLPLLGVPTTAQLSRGLDIHFCDGFFFLVAIWFELPQPSSQGVDVGHEISQLQAVAVLLTGCANFQVPCASVSSSVK